MLPFIRVTVDMVSFHSKRIPKTPSHTNINLKLITNFKVKVKTTKLVEENRKVLTIQEKVKFS